MVKQELSTHAIILAGGRGTRFWPRSRTRAPKQLLNIVGKTTMLEQTVARLRPLLPADHIWSVTNAEQAVALRKQLPAAARRRVLTEPVGRNTAAAIALAAIHVRHAVEGDALLAVLPADQYIARPEIYREIVRVALQLAREPERMLVLGIPPTRPDTGFGYVEKTGEPLQVDGYPVYAVRRFTEKPQLEMAKEYVASGNYQWNAGMFFWRVSTFLAALKKYLPKTHDALETLAPHIGKRSYDAALKELTGNSRIFRWTTPSWSALRAKAAPAGSSSSPRTSAGATSAPGLRSMNSSQSIRARMSLRVTAIPSTPGQFPVEPG